MVPTWGAVPVGSTLVVGSTVELGAELDVVVVVGVVGLDVDDVVVVRLVVGAGLPAPASASWIKP